ncbi:carboxypeptidase-like regulatory domain-containing protein [Hymenobacter cellulosilyticus]|uniref:Carboxypeptidase-like regulatory domain-containing protein n=1 Tax=Hymenobacter cellulosilyticus TaxID=2932248 RepID=A0A8T9Q8W0_9BACT|nr:carboxypeptidase-like regulatory domain-containing protein [Hymenobacter cellulosilyticus]UOQ71969.1 carboxypeptidase-like regulatory domain-containing protein [Hymenobacter cellulosilyticus]
MTYRYRLLLFFLFGLTFHLQAQTVGQISGTVRDRATQEVLPGVTVVLEGTDFGTATDEQGRYKLAGVPTGSYNLRASFVGYEALLRSNVSVTSGNANIINLELSAGPSS